MTDKKRDGLHDGLAHVVDGHAHSLVHAAVADVLVHKNEFFTTLLVDGKGPADQKLESFLKTEGHFVLRAESAADAVAMTVRFQPDLILLDSEWKGRSGLALLPDLLLARAAAAIILLAVKPSVPEAVQAMKMGAVEVLERPIDLKKLKQAMDLQKALFMRDIDVRLT